MERREAERLSLEEVLRQVSGRLLKKDSTRSLQPDWVEATKAALELLKGPLTRLQAAHLEAANAATDLIAGVQAAEEVLATAPSSELVPAVPGETEPAWAFPWKHQAAATVQGFTRGWLAAKKQAAAASTAPSADSAAGAANSASNSVDADSDLEDQSHEAAEGEQGVVDDLVEEPPELGAQDMPEVEPPEPPAAVTEGLRPVALEHPPTQEASSNQVDQRPDTPSTPAAPVAAETPQAPPAQEAPLAAAPRIRFLPLEHRRRAMESEYDSDNEIQFPNPGRAFGNEIQFPNPGRAFGNEIHFPNPGRPFDDEIEFPNPGSAQHLTGILGAGEGSCRPCAYFYKDVGCHKGTSCTFCHYPHEHRAKFKKGRGPKRHASGLSGA